MNNNTLITILIPTFNHGEMIKYPLQSALAQTHTNIEILVVGDGAPEITKETVAKFQEKYKNIFYFDNKKGEHQGELLRRKALESAKGEIVTYLADDDIWFPNHLETVIQKMNEGYNFVNTLCSNLSTELVPLISIVDMSSRDDIADMFENKKSFGTTFGAHTMDLYKKLEAPWSIAPKGTPTDLSFWQTLLRLVDCKPTSIFVATAIRLDAYRRHNMSTSARLAELQYVYDLSCSAEWRSSYTQTLFKALCNDADSHKKVVVDLQTTITTMQQTKTWKISKLLQKIIGYNK
jgi:glycosyltransferase involved in cell wall biosynthesis